MKFQKQVLISLMCALIASVLLGFYLQSLKDKYREKGKRVRVLVAKDYIPAYTLLKEDCVQAIEIPQQFIQPAALDSDEKLRSEKGSYLYSTVVPIMLGEQVTATKLATLGREAGLALVVPPGKRAISLVVDDVSGVAGLIKPGDYVDIIATFDYDQDGKTRSETRTIFQKVLVLATGQEVIGGTKKEERKAELAEEKIPRSVTLALAPVQAQEAIFIAEKGKMQLSLRPAGEDDVLEIPETKLSGLIAEPKATSVVKKKGFPEIIRGTEKQMQH